MSATTQLRTVLCLDVKSGVWMIEKVRKCLNKNYFCNNGMECQMRTMLRASVDPKSGSKDYTIVVSFAIYEVGRKVGTHIL